MAYNKTFICCICGNRFVGYGNNPWPVNIDDEAVCCNECNGKYVIPARLAGIMPPVEDVDESDSM